MKTIRQYIYREIVVAVFFVTCGFLGLFFFFDYVDELRLISRLGTKGYQTSEALLYVSLLIPGHLYELLPITVLIGTIFVMARLAKSSEFTILRTSGLGPWLALQMLLTLGLAFVSLTFLMGDYVAPLAERAAQLLRAGYQDRMTIGQTGAWLKEKQEKSSYIVNVGEINSVGNMKKIRIFEFDKNWHIISQTDAEIATFNSDSSWKLSDVKRIEHIYKTSAADDHRTEVKRSEVNWPTQISAEMVAASLLSPDRMRTTDLFQYIRHLDQNGQSAQRYEIEFWRKVFYPLSCIVMVVLALPFAYLHFRSGSVSAYVFFGVMAGISFFLLNNVFGFAGNLQNWHPWLAAAAPGLVYSLLSLGAFSWLVLRR